MAPNRLLTQEEIDSVFKGRQRTQEEDPTEKAQPYDFRRPDRIAKDQLRAIHMLHENYARSLASSLSAYLRAYVIVNLVSVEQLSFMEFTQCLPSPTVISALAMHPYDGSAVMELNPSLVFPIVEILLGGSAHGSSAPIDREVTEIEQSVIEGVYRIILSDMKEAWHPITDFDFEVRATETEPQMLQLLAPNEAVVAISMEIRIGEASGMMNIGIPSIVIKMLRQKFDQQWSLRKSESSLSEQARMLQMVGNARVYLDVRLEGPTVATQDLLALEPGDVLKLDFPIDRPLHLEINGLDKFEGQIVENGRKRCFHLENPILPKCAQDEVNAQKLIEKAAGATA